MSAMTGFLNPTVREEVRQLNRDPATSLGVSHCLGAIAAVANRQFRRRDLEARSAESFSDGPYVEINGGVAMAYFADFDDKEHVSAIVILHAGAAAPTGSPPLTWEWRQTAVQRYREYTSR